MARILVLSYHFYPSPKIGARRISELALALRDAGHAVTVIAAADAAPEAGLASRLHGLRIERVPVPRKLYARWAQRRRRRSRATRTEAGAAAPQLPPALTHEGLRARLRRWVHSMEWLLDDRKLWSWQALRRALALGREWDAVISCGPPVSVHVAARVVAAMSAAPWTMDMRDPWVDNDFWPAHVRSALRDRLEHALESTCIRHAARVVVAAPGMASSLAQRYPHLRTPVEVVLNGYDDPPLQPAAASGQLRLLYAGALYFNRDPFPLMEALQRLVQTPGVERQRVRLVLVGECTHWNGHDVAARARTYGLDDIVSVLPPVSAAEVRRLSAEAEVLVNFAQGQRRQIPGKLYEQIAAGRELLLITEPDSDAAEILRRSGAGRVVAATDSDRLSAVLQELYTFYVERQGCYAPDPAVVAQFSRERQNRRFMEILAATAAGA